MLHGDSSGLLHVCSSGNWSGLVCENTDQVLTYVSMMDMHGKQGIYLRATTLKGLLPAGSRGNDSDTKCIPGLWADIDIAGPGHKTEKPLPPTEDHARQIVERSPLPEPTLWVHSGGGLYPWWLLESAHEVDDLDDIANLSKGWHKILAQAASELGWFYGTEASDLSRVLRIPGTVNRKVADDPRMCIWAEGGCGKQYTLDELRTAMADGVAQLPQPEPPRPVPVTPSTTGEDSRPGDALEQFPWNHELLLADWYEHHTSGDVTYWTRPDKSPSQGWSATTGRDPQRDRLYVFSSSTPFEPHVPYTKFAAYALLHHGNDYSAAARELRRRFGFGSQEIATSPAKPMQLSPPVTEPVDGHVIDQETGWREFSKDDLGNGQRFAARYRDQVRRINDTEQWTIYEDGRWHLDSGDGVRRLAQNLVQELPELEGFLVQDQEGFHKWAAKQRSDARIKAMVSQASSMAEIGVKMGEFDANAMLLNCLNGTVDLTSGELLPHDPEHLLMEQANVDWDPDATCPMWEHYLARVMPAEQERLFLQRVTGYSITGDTSEQAVFIHYGFGANGKSVYLEVVGRLLSSYSLSVDSSTLLERKHERSASEDIARMKGKRFLRTSETNVGRRLNESQVKILAGGDDMINARHLYRNSFDFKPTGKIHLATNHIPQISNAPSIWRRLHVLGWDVEIPTQEQDQYLAQRILAHERAGVLAWMVRGCLEWQQLRLSPPESIRMRTETYRHEQDPLSEFVTECLKEAEKGSLEKTDRIYQVYRLWCDGSGNRAMSRKALTMALQERGFEAGRNSTYRGIYGVQAVTPMQSYGQIGWQDTS